MACDKPFQATSDYLHFSDLAETFDRGPEIASTGQREIIAELLEGSESACQRVVRQALGPLVLERCS